MAGWLDRLPIERSRISEVTTTLSPSLWMKVPLRLVAAHIAMVISLGFNRFIQIMKENDRGMDV